MIFPSDKRRRKVLCEPLIQVIRGDESKSTGLVVNEKTQHFSHFISVQSVTSEQMCLM